MIHVSKDTRREESVGRGSLDHLVFFFHHFLAAFTGMRNILWGLAFNSSMLNLEGSNVSRCFLLPTSCYQIHQQSSEDNHQTSDQS